MNTMRKLALLAIAAIAAMAMGASTASAQTIEVTNEAGGAHCGAVSVANHIPAGGCNVRAVTEPNTSADLFIHLTGVGEVQFSACTNVFEARINEDGIGYIYNQVLADLAGSEIPCGIAPCDEAEPGPNQHVNHEWPIVAWEGGGGNEALATTFCSRPVGDPEGTAGTYCSVAVEASQVGHAQEFTAGDPAGDGNSCNDSNIELVGHWLTTGVDATHAEINITHIHPGS